MATICWIWKSKAQAWWALFKVNFEPQEEKEKANAAYGGKKHMGLYKSPHIHLDVDVWEM